MNIPDKHQILAQITAISAMERGKLSACLGCVFTQHKTDEKGQHQLHEPTDQVGIMALGQDIQTRVVDHQGQPLAPLLLAPTSKAISRLDVQGGGTPGGYGQPLAFPRERVAQLLAHQFCAVQVMALD